MEAHRFDSIIRLFATRRLSRRHALARAGTGLAAGALAAAGLTRPTRAQDAPPAAKDGPTMLFLQAFRAGSVAPKAGAEGRYVLTLEQGLGQTIYFSDRPDRIVGATPTPRFLAGLGFPDDNPPNAALVVETAAGQTEVAVVELFSPVYDEATHTATYEVAVLAEWERAAEAGFAETETDLAQLLPRFGAAHLLIDSPASEQPTCDQARVYCYTQCTLPPFSDLGAGLLCWSHEDQACRPCDERSLDERCNADYPEYCSGQCFASTNFHAVCG